MRGESNGGAASRNGQTEQTGMTSARIAQIVAFILILIVLAGIGWAAVHYRQSVVRLWPESSGLYRVAGFAVNLGGVAFPEVEIRRAMQDGVATLSVSGRVVNVSDREQPIPRLRVVLFDDSKRELYRWTFDPGIRTLPPRGEHDFGTTLPSPPPDAHSADVTVAADDGE